MAGQRDDTSFDTGRTARGAAGGAASRRTVVLMREALVEAKLGVAAVRRARDAARRRLEAERTELETVRRRGRLAAQVPDAETVRVAARFEAHHAERVAVLEGTLAARERELALAEREMAEMTAELRRVVRGGAVATGAAAGEGGGDAGGTSASAPDGAVARAPDATAEHALRGELERLAREAVAERQLAELKRRVRRP